jgi:hypothetical protein
MAETIFFDRGTSVFIGMELEKIREAVKEELKRYDITDAVRRELRVTENALNRTISVIGARRPRKQGKELDYPQYVAVVRGEYVARARTAREAMDELEANVGTDTLDTFGFEIYKVVRDATDPIPVFTPQPPGSEEQAEQRRKEVIQRKRMRQLGQEKNFGKAVNFRIEDE